MEEENKEKDLGDVIRELEAENEQEALEKEKLEEAKLVEEQKPVEEVKPVVPVTEPVPVPPQTEPKQEEKKSKKKLIIIISIIVGVLLIAGILLLLLLGGKKTFTVTYDTAGGTKIGAETVKKGEIVYLPSEPTKEGYKFVCWEYKGSCYTAINIEVKEDVTFKAKWEAVEDDSNTEYTITFEYENGRPSKTIKVRKGNTIPEQPDPTREGYDFICWEYNGYPFYFYDEVDKDMTIYAKWHDQKDDEYIINFNSNGGSSVSSQTVKKGNKVVEPKEPTKEGYEFVEWRLNGSKFDFNKEISGNLTLIAEWREIITIKFDSNGGSSVPSQTVKYGGTVTKPADPTKANATFEGWYQGSNKYNFDDKVTNSFTLTAKWKDTTPTPLSGDKVTCEMEQTEDGITIHAIIIGQLDTSGKVSKLSYRYEFTDKETADQYCALVQLAYPEATCSGTTVSIPNIDDDLDDFIGLTKEQFIAAAKDDGDGVKCY